MEAYGKRSGDFPFVRSDSFPRRGMRTHQDGQGSTGDRPQDLRAGQGGPECGIPGADVPGGRRKSRPEGGTGREFGRNDAPELPGGEENPDRHDRRGREDGGEGDAETESGNGRAHRAETGAGPAAGTREAESPNGRGTVQARGQDGSGKGGDRHEGGGTGPIGRPGGVG